MQGPASSRSDLEIYLPREEKCIFFYFILCIKLTLAHKAREDIGCISIPTQLRILRTDCRYSRSQHRFRWVLFYLGSRPWKRAGRYTRTTTTDVKSFKPLSWTVWVGAVVNYGGQSGRGQLFCEYKHRRYSIVD